MHSSKSGSVLAFVDFLDLAQLLISCHGMDVGRGVSIGPAFSLPHPVGIVIGRGVTIGARCAIFQGVTLGRARDKYPRIGSDVVIYPNAIIVGDIDIPDGTRVRALSFLPESRELCIGQERYNREG
jgi:serine acetyltransferase